MEESINQIINDISNIKYSLEILSTEGMRIIDTYADVSTPLNFKLDLLIAIIGTIIGGIVTIILFRMQERMRVRQELKLEFFKDYKKLYVEFSDSFCELKTEIQVTKCLKERDKCMYELIHDVKRVYVRGSEDLKKLTNICKDTYRKIEILSKHIDNNQMIMKKYKKEKYELVSSHIFLISKYLGNIDYCLDEFYKDSYTVYPKEIIIKKYEENLKKVIDECEKIEGLNVKVNEIHGNMETKFLKKYF